MNTDNKESLVSEFIISVEQIQDFEFRVRFDKPHHAELALDEPAPLGKDTAPNASRILAAAIGNCLSASLLFCARKGRVEVGPIARAFEPRLLEPNKDGCELPASRWKLIRISRRRTDRKRSGVWTSLRITAP